MRVGFLVNAPGELVSTQTTTLLVAAARRQAHDVALFGVTDLEIEPDDRVIGRAVCPHEAETEAVASELRGSPAEARCTLDELDLLVVRTNPGRDHARRPDHLAALGILAQLEERGVPIVNRPRGLFRALSKLSLLELPANLRPRTLVTRDPEAIERFVEAEPGRSVIKPLDGSRGRDVFLLDPVNPSLNLRAIVDVVLRGGYAMAQEFVPGAEAGDVRVTVLFGEPMELDGCPAAIARVPSDKDFRSNLHAGGRAETVALTPQMRDAVRQMAPALERLGLHHVGVDFVGDQVLELNCFSPGGIHPAERLHQRDFASGIMKAFTQWAQGA